MAQQRCLLELAPQIPGNRVTHVFEMVSHLLGCIAPRNDGQEATDSVFALGIPVPAS